jgi:pimeloyl-ACP methyl ester carboxylesterase
VAVLAGVLALCGCQFRGGDHHAAPGGAVTQAHCPDGSAFECITLAVPADHFAPASPTWHVTFALHRGSVDSRGVLVLAAGGPGDSGIDEADTDLSFLPRDITDHHDVVLFDQRGVGRSEPFQCTHALAQDRSGVLTSSSPTADRDAYAAAAQEFSAACFAEAGVAPGDAPRYSTRQAVEDLEVFRHWLGADRLVLYGESYGTQFQQAYAAAHPHRVAAMVLDGVVDPGTDALTMAGETAQAYSDVLAATLAACDAEPACAGDAPGTAAAGYDQLATQLRSAPLPGGEHGQGGLTLLDLQGAADASLSGPQSRRDLQRALNAAVRGDLTPLARLAAESPSAGVGRTHDPSDAVYDAVECQDFAFLPEGTSGRGQLDVWLAAASAAGVDQLRLGGMFYGDLPCLFWPSAGGGWPPPAPVTDPPYPVLLLTADTDPNTPTQNAHRVFDRSRNDAALVILQGGPHVIYGRNVPCVDNPVHTLVTTRRLPSQAVTVCPGQVAATY